MLMLALSSLSPRIFLILLALGLVVVSAVTLQGIQPSAPAESVGTASGPTRNGFSGSWRPISINRAAPSPLALSVHVDLGIPPQPKRNRREAFADALRALLSDKN